MPEILRYEHVDIAYNGKVVVQDVSFTLEDGEILGIVGESGSGKSTVIKAAMGLLGPAGQVTRGDIYYKGHDLPDLSPAQIRKLNGPELSMIFQEQTDKTLILGAAVFAGDEAAVYPDHVFSG